jgi:hypothetical protein
MNVNILKRLAAVENKVAKTENPDMIQIYFDDSKGKYAIVESYCNHDGRGNIAQGGRRNVIFLDHYKDYIFAETTHAQVLLDLIDSPDNGNLHAFHTDELRKDCNFSKNQAFSICYTGIEQGEKQLEAVFDIQPYERK